MAIFTDLDEADRAVIIDRYRLPPPLSVIGIADGDRETTFLFRCGAADYIVTLFEQALDGLELEQAFQVMERLAQDGVPCPLPLRTADGQAAIRVAGKLAAVVSFVPGTPSRRPGPGKCRDLGRNLALIHLSSMGTTGGRGAAMQGLPEGWVHGALTPENVFFMDDRVTGIINFRRRHRDVLAVELAELLVNWCAATSGALDRDRCLALLDGYGSVRPVGAAERAALPALVLAATARQGALTGRGHRARAAALTGFDSIRMTLGMDMSC